MNSSRLQYPIVESDKLFMSFLYKERQISSYHLRSRVESLQDRQIAGLVARDGNLCIWPIIEGSVGEITMERVSGPVRAVSAASVESTAMIFIGTESGTVHCMRTTDGSSATISKLGQGPPSSQVLLPLHPSSNKSSDKRTSWKPSCVTCQTIRQLSPRFKE